jgi:hypothetical protein
MNKPEWEAELLLWRSNRSAPLAILPAVVIEACDANPGNSELLRHVSWIYAFGIFIEKNEEFAHEYQKQATKEWGIQSKRK